MALPIRRHGSSPGGVLKGLHLGDFERMWEQMGRYLEQAAAPTTGRWAWMPMAEETENDRSYTLKLELPGYPAENIDIEVNGDQLVVSGSLSEEQHGKVLIRRQGGFTYRTSLPAGADPEHCEAGLDNGVLTLTVPKATRRQHRRKIEIGQGRPHLGGGSAVEKDGSVEPAGEREMTPAEERNAFVTGGAAADATGERTAGSSPDDTAAREIRPDPGA
ncbi:Hsp20/alpha crystallin family protein [Streptomyces sp. NPDC091259]|uniref:Hsp20/alpha crystallin family protein n=1 Tax=Streptomyces sp. NPDC091259 TaxID=3365976 RepID=UPI00382ACD1D